MRLGELASWHRAEEAQGANDRTLVYLYGSGHKFRHYQWHVILSAIR
jgi:hypothetical protein